MTFEYAFTIFLILKEIHAVVKYIRSIGVARLKSLLYVLTGFCFVFLICNH